MPAILLALLPLAKYGVALRSEFVPLTLVTLVAAYGVAIYLYRSTALLAAVDRYWQVVSAAAVGLAAGLVVCHADYRLMMIGETLMIPAAGIVVGRRLRGGDKGLRSFVFGAMVVMIGGIVMFAPTWDRLMIVFEAIGRESAGTFSAGLISLGYHPDAVTDYATQLENVIHTVTRLIPAATLMNLLVQFTVGFLWLLGRDFAAAGSPAALAPFARWKVPFTLTPVLIVAALGRLFGGELVALVADNLLMMLSVFYCVGGLALIAHALRRLRMPLAIRVVFYIALTLTGLLGYLGSVLLGFVDSFADWRKVSRPSIELDKT
ncbi:MAG: DUF2232 domain-containing protein [Candidatus Zixiibacteriota bacterium]